MTKYVATINTPGYLPQDDDPPVFDTAREDAEFVASDATGYPFEVIAEVTVSV